MVDKPTVFLSEYVSEDTNPWDSRERFGIYSTFEGAAKSLDWLTRDDNTEVEANRGWGKTDTYGGSRYVKADNKVEPRNLVKNCWKWSEKNEDGVYEDDGEGYGLYIWEEYVDGHHV